MSMYVCVTQIQVQIHFKKQHFFGFTKGKHFSFDLKSFIRTSNFRKQIKPLEWNHSKKHNITVIFDLLFIGTLLGNDEKQGQMEKQEAP